MIQILKGLFVSRSYCSLILFRQVQCDEISRTMPFSIRIVYEIIIENSTNQNNTSGARLALVLNSGVYYSYTSFYLTII